MLDITFKARYHEMDQNGLIPLWTLLNYFQESAGEDAHNLSFGWEEMSPKGIAWVITKFEIKLLKEVKGVQNISIKTWHCMSDKLQSRRDFIMYNQQGEEIAKGISWWVILDLAKRRIVRNPQSLLDLNPQNPAPVMEASDIRTPKFEGVTPLNSIKVIARLEDIDSNAHVNNAHFSAWAIDAMPADLREGLQLEDLIINYRAEVKQADEITASVYPAEDGVYWHILTRPADGKEIASVRTVWRKK